jgi:hypothetical protein
MIVGLLAPKVAVAGVLLLLFCFSEEIALNV